MYKILNKVPMKEFKECTFILELDVLVMKRAGNLSKTVQKPRSLQQLVLKS